MRLKVLITGRFVSLSAALVSALVADCASYEVITLTESDEPVETKLSLPAGIPVKPPELHNLPPHDFGSWLGGKIDISQPLIKHESHRIVYKAFMLNMPRAPP